MKAVRTLCALTAGAAIVLSLAACAATPVDTGKEAVPNLVAPAGPARGAVNSLNDYQGQQQQQINDMQGTANTP